MALDIMQTLVQYLCPTYAAEAACNTFINSQSHQIMQPFGPLLFFLFFPAVFLILFIYVGSRAILSGNRGINLLIGIAVFIFIIIQGWYPIILVIGELWFIFLPVLFIFYLITRRHSGGSSGGGPMFRIGGSDRTSQLLTAARNRVKRQISGEVTDMERQIRANIGAMEGMVKKMKRAKAGSDVDNIYRAYSELLNLVNSQLPQFRKEIEVGGPLGGFKAGPEYNRLLKKFESVQEEMKHVYDSKSNEILKKSA